MEIVNDDGLSALINTDSTMKLADGFYFTEGPVWLPAEQVLIFSDIPGNKTLSWRPGADGAEVYREPSGHTNGHTIDAAGNLLACEHSGRRVSRGAVGAEMQTLAGTFEGKKFNSPNDLVIDGSGAVYFTDPNYGLMQVPEGRLPMGDPDAEQEIDLQGVYRVETDGGIMRVVDDFSQPNGLAFNPDGSVLYIGDSQDSIIRRFDVAADGSLSGGELFVDMRDDDRPGVPDGMKVDEDGRLWTTGAGGVWVIASDGQRLGVFEGKGHAANLTFGGADFSTLFLTAGRGVYSIETSVRGIAPGSR